MAATKKTVKVKYSKGITISKDYQSVRYEIGVEMDFDLGSEGEGFRDAVEKLEEMVNKELKRRKQASGLHALGDE